MTTIKHSKFMHHRGLRVTLLVVVIIIGGSVGSYVFKDSVKRVYYEHKATTAFESQSKKLSSALSPLGIANTTVGSKCRTESIFGYSAPQLQCLAEQQNYVVIGTNAVSQARFVLKAQELDNLLKTNGWVTTSNSASTIGQWFQGITTGKDYSTDSNSIRNDGSSHCSLSFTVAYSNPKPPAYDIRMSCSAPVLEKVKGDATF